MRGINAYGKDVVQHFVKKEKENIVEEKMMVLVRRERRECRGKVGRD